VGKGGNSWSVKHDMMGERGIYTSQVAFCRRCGGGGGGGLVVVV